MEKLGTNKLNMQKLLAPAALVILYIVFSIFGNNFLSLDMVKNILESSYYIGFMAFGVTFVIITGGIDLSLGTAMMIAFLITALWWAGAAVPLFRRYRQVHYAEAGGHPVRDSFRRLGRTY